MAHPKDWNRRYIKKGLVTYASGEGREGNAIDGQLVTGDDVVGEAAAELATGGGRHDLPRAEISGSGGGGADEESSN